jgi:DNA-binding transcriptional MerR regulator
MTNKQIEAYRTIGEVAQELELPQYVIRFWESKFSSLRPKRINKRRYYSTKQFNMIQQIKTLLYEKKYTISGAIAYLKQQNNSDSNNNIINKIRNNLLNLHKKLTDYTIL